MEQQTTFDTKAELKSLMSLSAPLIIIHLAITGMQFADALMVAHLGDEALAAVMPAGFAFFVLLSFGWGFFSVVSTFVSQSLGKKNDFACGQYTWNAMWIAIAYGTLLVPVFWKLGPPFFSVMGHEPQVQVYEVVYFRVSLYGAVPNLMLMTVSNFFTGLHRTKYLLLSAVTGSVLNIIFNYYLIFGHWIFPELGVAGSAWGTVYATICQCIIIFYLFWKPEFRLKYHTAKLVFSWKQIKQLLRVGAPGGFQGVWDLVTWGIILTWMIGLFGTEPLAANTIVVRYLHLSFMPAIAVGFILTAIIGKSIGEQQIERANKQAYLALKVIMSYMLSIGVLYFFFRESFIRVFSDNPQVIDAGKVMLLFAAIFQVFDALMITFSFALRGAGDTKFPAMALIACSTIFLCGGGYFMVKFYPEFGALGPWSMTTLYIACLGLTLTARWIWGPWRRINIFT
jgi:multidrug resistance protein, MATE family